MKSVFDPPLLMIRQGTFLKADFSSDFLGLIRVDIIVVAAATNPTLTDPLLDNVEYIAHYQ